MNFTEAQKAEIELAIRQHKQELWEIRRDPRKFIEHIQHDVDLFNEALGLKEPLALVNIPSV